MSSVRSTSDGRGPVTRKGSGQERAGETCAVTSDVAGSHPPELLSWPCGCPRNQELPTPKSKVFAKQCVQNKLVSRTAQISGPRNFADPSQSFRKLPRSFQNLPPGSFPEASGSFWEAPQNFRKLPRNFWEAPQSFRKLPRSWVARS